MVSRQFDAPDVPMCGPGLPPSAWVASWTWSVPKYEKPGESPSTQCAADAPPAVRTTELLAMARMTVAFASLTSKMPPTGWW